MTFTRTKAFKFLTKADTKKHEKTPIDLTIKAS